MSLPDNSVVAATVACCGTRPDMDETSQSSGTSVDSVWSDGSAWGSTLAVADESVEPGILDPAVLYCAIVDSVIVDSAIVDSAIVDSAIVDSAIVDSAIVDSAIVDSAIVDCALVEFTGATSVPWSETSSSLTSPSIMMSSDT
jgi:hypothetical protein